MSNEKLTFGELCGASPNINWSKIPQEYQWAAMDSDRNWYAHTAEPAEDISHWTHSEGDYFHISPTPEPAPDWTTSLQKRPETDMSEIELKVGQIYGNKGDSRRREIVAIHGSSVAYKYTDIEGNKWCSCSNIEDFKKHLAHKLVDSLEFPKEKKTVRKAQCVVHCSFGDVVSTHLVASIEEAKRQYPHNQITWPIVVNGVEQWVEVEE